MRVDAIGFVEVVGLVAAIEAGDAMAKAAQVRLLKTHFISPGWTTVVVEGNLAACQAAVDAGRAAAARLGVVLASLVIPRPDGDTETLVLDQLRPEAILGVVAEPPASSALPSPHLAAEAEEDQVAAQEAELLAFIAASTRGRTGQEVARHLHITTAAARHRLDQLLTAGRLEKSGNRYHAPAR